MKITTLLRKHMVDHFKVDAGAPEGTVREAVVKALGEMTLTPAKLAELSVQELSEADARIKSAVDEAVAPIRADMQKGLDALTAAVSRLNTAPAILPVTEKSTAQTILTGGDGASTGTQTTEEIARIQFKNYKERFNDTKSALTYNDSPKAYLKGLFGHKQLETGPGDVPSRMLNKPTEWSKAVTGAWFKHLINRSSAKHDIPQHLRMTESDRKLVECIVHECKFVGPHNFVDDRGGGDARHWFAGESVTNEMHRKALLDDTTSGGLEAVPIEFDDSAIMTPLLVGELFPFVTIRNVTRRRIEGFSIGNPTLSWGTNEGTGISLFNTDNFIQAFDTNIYPVVGAIELGLDFESDSPVGIGDMVISRYGVRFQQEMDNVIANGNGTDRPRGLFQTAGLGTVNSANGTGGNPTIGDYEQLLFGVKKQFRQEATQGRAVFIGTEASYTRMRGIPVGTSDARRLFGMDEESYMCFDHPYKINESIANTTVGFFCLNRYRMYRRQGFEVKIVTEGLELARKNQRAIIVRARFGGQFELGGAGVLCSDMKA